MTDLDTKQLRERLTEALKYDERIWRAFQTLKTCHREGFLDALQAANASTLREAESYRDAYFQNWNQAALERDALLDRVAAVERELADLRDSHYTTREAKLQRSLDIAKREIKAAWRAAGVCDGVRLSTEEDLEDAVERVRLQRDEYQTQRDAAVARAEELRALLPTVTELCGLRAVHFDDDAYGLAAESYADRIVDALDPPSPAQVSLTEVDPRRVYQRTLRERAESAERQLADAERELEVLRSTK
jgi:hypothetical protein